MRNLMLITPRGKRVKVFVFIFARYGMTGSNTSELEISVFNSDQ